MHISITQNLLKGGVLFLLILLNSVTASAQFPDFCATDLKVAQSLKNNPERLKFFIKQQQLNHENDKRNFASGYASEKAKSIVYIIPIVFHIIHENGPENISDAQVYDAVRVLNDDYRKLNSDTNQIIPVFQPVAADCQIEFRLAQLDPNGNCTNGIDRIYSSQTNIGDDGSKLNPWPDNMYFNVWVVRSISPGGIAGYAYYPGTAPAGAEGVILLHSYLGSIGTSTVNHSRVLTHETGHYLNLAHVWGSTNNPGVACGDDGIGDTPETKGWTSCNVGGNVCNSGVIENVQNYMEYSYCTNMFTWGQKSSMDAALNSFAGSRNSLWISSNLLATGVINQASLCTADFSAFPLSSTVCAGEAITFRDMSFNGKPNAWQWSFPGGTLINSSSVTDSMPVVQYVNAGAYDVSLTVSNSTSAASVTKTGYVVVSPSSATYNSNFYVESFENILIPGTDWSVQDLDGLGISWQVANNAHYSGQSSAYLNNNAASAGDADELISPSINIANIGSPYFSFYYAFAPDFSGSADQLIVFVSTNCGKTWYPRKTIIGANLATAAATISPFVPGAGEWKQEIMNINNVLNQANVRFKFKFIGGGGNNVYLDDINIISTLGIHNLSSENQTISVYPNPFNDYTSLTFNLSENSYVAIEITDMLGQPVRSVSHNFYSAGKNQIKIEKDNSLKPGFYFLNLVANNKRSVAKIVVR